MAEYFIQQKALSANSRTLVQDDQGNNLFMLIGHWGNYGDTITLYDLAGETLGRIKQTSRMGSTRFALFTENKKVGNMQKIPIPNQDWYFISKLNWLAKGDLNEHRYLIKHGKTVIMKMLGAHLVQGDFYSLVIPNDDNVILSILIASVLDYWLYHSKPTVAPKFRRNPRVAWD